MQQFVRPELSDTQHVAIGKNEPQRFLPSGRWNGNEAAAVAEPVCERLRVVHLPHLTLPGTVLPLTLPYGKLRKGAATWARAWHAQSNAPLCKPSLLTPRFYSSALTARP